MKLNKENEIVKWLLSGDVSLQYQVHRDLLSNDREDLRERIATEGWGKKFLAKRNKNGHWGRAFYQPKWTSTHYTLLDLKNLSISPKTQAVRDSVAMVVRDCKGPDGGINPSDLLRQSDVCINGMALNYASYFGANEEDLKSIVDFILSEHMPDGGFNCHSNRKGAVHSSMHTTLSVMEGITEYINNGYKYRAKELVKAEAESREFLLLHKFYQSHRTGEVMDKKMLMLSYPSRWRYDILRALDYFRAVNAKYDERMSDALSILIKKRRADMKWPLQAKHLGQTHFEMEIPGKPSRWNTLRSMRVLKHFINT